MSNNLCVSSAASEVQCARLQRLAPSSWIRPLDRLISPVALQAESSFYLLDKTLGEFQIRGETYRLPRYLFFGPRGGGDTVRLGIFATIQGNEPEGALGLIRFLAALECNPILARGYALFIYPVCNPSGYESNIRCSRNGKDLDQEFWRGSVEPEVQWLEREIWTHAFHGIVTLHSSDTSDGICGFVHRPLLSEYLLEPALAAAEVFLPRNRSRRIAGLTAYNGIIYKDEEGILRAPPELRQPPFEISLETPRKAPLHLQSEAFSAALLSILAEYQQLLAFAQNL